jgi:hypothetical protein
MLLITWHTSSIIFKQLDHHSHELHCRQLFEEFYTKKKAAGINVGGPVVIVLAIVPKVCRSKPGQG